jgi:hypothetical protein
VGHFEGISNDRVQVLGQTESSFVAKMSPEAAAGAFDALLAPARAGAFAPPAAIVDAWAVTSHAAALAELLERDVDILVEVGSRDDGAPATFPPSRCYPRQICARARCRPRCAWRSRSLRPRIIPSSSSCYSPSLQPSTCTW